MYNDNEGVDKCDLAAYYDCTHTMLDKIEHVRCYKYTNVLY